MLMGGEQFMNILIGVDKNTLDKHVVMLTSLFENNANAIEIFCIENEKNEEIEFALNSIIERYSKKIHYIYETELYLKNELNVNIRKAYKVLLSSRILPDTVDRILYLKEDVIVNGDLSEFYYEDFQFKALIVRGQSSKSIKGRNYRIGARPEKGQFFDERALMINLEKLREEYDVKKIEESLSEYTSMENISSQGILNVVFKNDVKYEADDKYNYRYSICEEFAKAGKGLSVKDAIIISYEKRDYYRIGKVTMPWNLVLLDEEIKRLKNEGIIKCKYDLRESDKANAVMIDFWWKYAEKTSLCKKLKSEMMKEKINILSLVSKTSQQILHYNKIQQALKKLMENKIEPFDEILDEIKYEDIETYIDSIEKTLAVKTMKNLFQINCKRLSEKEKIKVGFLVYSASEWQCEEIYRMLEKDSRFEPSIIVAFIDQSGNEKIMRETYEDTRKWFSSEGKVYRIVLMNDIENDALLIEEFDILVYFYPFALFPVNVNINRRKISQLCIHIPYGYYLVSKDDARYGGEYYEKSIFKLVWHYFAPCELQKKSATSRQRLEGYNIVTSGFPKLDSLIKKDFFAHTDLWKVNEATDLKIIWAPHFNMEKGMNGTFHENYIWMYNFAKNNPNISWIVKPHPRMKRGVMEKGLFESEAEYEEYIEKWNSLDNAKVIESGDYYDIFFSSDAMILDSLSFLAEYQFTGKPLLWLYPKEQRAMEELGEKLLSVLYQSRGNDFKKIEKFIDKCRLNEDCMYKERQAFFREYMDCYSGNEKIASEYIYDLICEEIWMKI